jgi:hypothetical protein
MLFPAPHWGRDTALGWNVIASLRHGRARGRECWFLGSRDPSSFSAERRVRDLGHSAMSSYHPGKSVSVLSKGNSRSSLSELQGHKDLPSLLLYFHPTFDAWVVHGSVPDCTLDCPTENPAGCFIPPNLHLKIP